MKRSTLIRRAEDVAEAVGFDIPAGAWMDEPIALHEIDPRLPEMLSTLLSGAASGTTTKDGKYEALASQVERNTRTLEMILTKIRLQEGWYLTASDWCQRNDMDIDAGLLDEQAADLCDCQGIGTGTVPEADGDYATTYPSWVLKYLAMD